MEPNVYVVQVIDSTQSASTGLEPGTYAVWVFPKTPLAKGGAELMFKPLGERTFRPAAALTQEQ